MASLFRRSYTKVDPKTGQRRRYKTAKWYGQFLDHDGILRRVPLCNDKAAAATILNELVRNAERRLSGLTDRYTEHAERRLADFRAHLDAKANSPKYVALTANRVAAVFGGCGFDKLGDVSASAVVAQLDGRRRAGLSLQSLNEILAAVKGFTRWAQRDGRAADDPLAHVAGWNASTDVRRERRALTTDELGRLIDAAQRSPRTFRGLDGPARALLYLTAANTGLRASELASLTLDSFDLADDPPCVTVAAAYSKRRRKDRQPMRGDLAARLGPYLARIASASPRRPADKPAREDGACGKGRRPRATTPAAWPGSWADRSADMLAADLRDAGVERIDEGGRVVDFHALRHTFVTNLVRGGVHPKDAKELARHSTITLTMDRYVHLNVRDAAAALESPPALPSTGLESQPASATGTDGQPAPEKLALKLALPGDLSRPRRAQGPQAPRVGNSRKKPRKRSGWGGI